MHGVHCISSSHSDKLVCIINSYRRKFANSLLFELSLHNVECYVFIALKGMLIQETHYLGQQTQKVGF
jgi:hypothetical protein